MSNEYITASGFLVIEATRDGAGRINGAKFVRTGKRNPVLQDEQRAVQLRVKLPVSAFEPLGPVRIEIPEGEIIAPEVTVDA